jgi:hypothetical protein
VRAGGSITAQTVAAGDDIVLRAGTGIVTLALTAGGTERATADRGDGAADELARLALPGADLAGGGSIVLDAATNVSTGPITGDFDVAIRAAGTITTGDIAAGDDIALVGTDISTAALTSGAIERTVGDRPNGAADLLTRTTLLDGDASPDADLTGGGTVFADASGNFAASGATSADFDVAVRAGGSITAQTVAAGDDIVLDAGTGIVTLALTAGGTERATADRGDGAADELARLALPGADLAGGGSIVLDAGTNVSTGPITGDFDVAIRAAGTITTGDIAAGDDIALVGTDISTAALTSGAIERTVGDRPNGAADLLTRTTLLDGDASPDADLTGGGTVFADASGNFAASGATLRRLRRGGAGRRLDHGPDGRCGRRHRAPCGHRRQHARAHQRLHRADHRGSRRRRRRRAGPPGAAGLRSQRRRLCGGRRRHHRHPRYDHQRL